MLGEFHILSLVSRWVYFSITNGTKSLHYEVQTKNKIKYKKHVQNSY